MYNNIDEYINEINGSQNENSDLDKLRRYFVGKNYQSKDNSIKIGLLILFMKDSNIIEINIL